MAGQLIPMPEVQQLTSRVVRILGGNPSKFTLQGTNTYLVGTGDNKILIDTGEGRPSWIDAVRRRNDRIATVLLTHWHHDHVGGIDQLRSLYPEAKFYKHQPSKDQLEIVDGQRFCTEGATLRAVHAPGHTTDHMCLVLEEEDALFTGDNVLGQGTAVFEDYDAYMKSLERMKSLTAGTAYPGHGPVIENGRAKIMEYVAHRQKREEQVLQILRSSRFSTESSKSDAPEPTWTSMEIVKIIYKDVPESLHMPAQGGILQILAKLEHEDKVVRQALPDGWRLKKRASL